MLRLLLAALAITLAPLALFYLLDWLGVPRGPLLGDFAGVRHWLWAVGGVGGGEEVRSGIGECNDVGYIVTLTRLDKGSGLICRTR